MAADDKSSERSYRVSKSYKLDLADSGAITALRDEFGKDATIEVAVKIGSVMKKTPKEALTALGQKKDLDGDYEAVSESTIKTFKVKVETRREVSIS